MLYKYKILTKEPLRSGLVVNYTKNISEYDSIYNIESLTQMNATYQLGELDNITSYQD